jgi:polar amino acid transport system substrate-binding protein
MKEITSSILSMLLIGALLVVGLNSTAMAQSPAQAVKESTLTKVVERKLLRVGVLTTVPPWGYLDKDYKNVGFDIDVAKMMAQELGVELKLIETEGVNRVPFLVTGKVDIVIGVFGATLERAKSVAFSKPYAPYALSIVGRKDDTKFKSWTDTAGKKVAVARGTTNDLIFTKKAPKGTQIIRYDLPTDCFLAMEQGKVDAVGEGYTVCAYQVKIHPAWEIKGEPFARTFPGFGIPLGDQVWLNWANLFIEQNLAEGKFQELWEKHFKIPWIDIWPDY